MIPLVAATWIHGCYYCYYYYYCYCYYYCYYHYCIRRGSYVERPRVCRGEIPVSSTSGVRSPLRV